MTYQELQDYVRERLGIASTDSSRVTLIQRTINAEYLNACVRAEATLASQTVTLTNGNPVVNLGADVHKVKGILRSNPGGRLTPVSTSQYTFLAGMFTGGDVPSAPSYYMVLQGSGVLSVRVWPTPSVTDSGCVAFVVAKPTALSASGDVPSALPEAYHHAVIGERAVQRVALAEQDVALAGTAGQLADEAFAALTQHVRDRNGELDGAMTVFGDQGLPVPMVLGQAVR